MLGLDTNVLVRLLIEDDPAQTQRARKLVDAAIAEEESVLVSLPVLLETEWVLRTARAASWCTWLLVASDCGGERG